jgi:two-component system CheB/CheR fusion protein
MSDNNKKAGNGNKNENGVRSKKNNTIKKVEKYAVPNKDEPVAYVCIGGSAGSIEPLQVFFENMPDDTGLSFIVIQHLDPNYKTLMPELLSNWTKMSVAEVQDGVKALPNYVYVIPPNKEMTILAGTFVVFDSTRPRGQRMPIDVFMESLAKDQGEKAIGIILSGLDSDGVRGAKFIKTSLGMIMAQSPESSKYDSMPTNAIQKDYVDYIAEPKELPEKLLSYIQNSIKLKIPKGEKTSSEKFNNNLQRIFILLRNHTGHDFSLYKRNTIHRRIERRMNTHQISEISNYVKLLQENPAEIDLLFKELLIGVTKFFRDPEAFNVLRHEIIPNLLKEKEASETFRVWCAGVSTGEEVYSIAMIVLECLAEIYPLNKIPVQIFATDLDQDAFD